jgi:hypothetical protein
VLLELRMMVFPMGICQITKRFCAAVVNAAACLVETTDIPVSSRVAVGDSLLIPLHGGQTIDMLDSLADLI